MIGCIAILILEGRLKDGGKVLVTIFPEVVKGNGFFIPIQGSLDHASESILFRDPSVFKGFYIVPVNAIYLSAGLQLFQLSLTYFQILELGLFL